MTQVTYFLLMPLSFISLLLQGCTLRHEQLLTHQKPAFYAYQIGDTQSSRVYLKKNADVYITPASCQKITTALLSYKTLGKDYRYQTAIYTITKNKQTQDIIVSFSGDPTLSSARLITLLKPLKKLDFKGRLIIDVSAFQTPPLSPNIMRDDVGTRYAQPVSAFIVDQNIIHVTVESLKKHKKAKLHNDVGYKIHSKVISNLEPSQVELKWKGNIIQATGHINIHDKPLILKISPPDIQDYIHRKLTKILKNVGIKRSFIIIQDPTKIPTHKKRRYHSHSDPLQTIIGPAFKESDNLFFDSVYLTMINQNSPIPIQKWEEGHAIVKNLIQEHFNLDIESALIIDGSGLSRYNRLQPKTLFALLQKGYFNKDFVSIFPKPGEVNTSLENRNLLPSTIRAKTGAMSGISCLCGYDIQGNRSKIFVMVANSFAPPLQEMFAIQDRFIRKHLEH